MGRGKHLTRKPDSTEIPRVYLTIRDKLLPYSAKGIPESTACRAERINWEAWAEGCRRYPALRQELQKAEAEWLIARQEVVEAGAAGWQASATLLERRDPGNWSRSYQPVGKQKQSALQKAVLGRAKKA